MDAKIKKLLKAKLTEWIEECDSDTEFPFYFGGKTITQFVQAVEVVYDARAEAAELEHNENEPS